jgi:hypothetical protein
MGTKDPRVDAYIAKSADFAKPILKHIRKVVHAGCPDVEETIKWQFPHFDYKGVLCGMAAFKQHCAFGFWKEALIFDRDKTAEKTAMGSFGCIKSLADLPNEKTLIGCPFVAINRKGAIKHLPGGNGFNSEQDRSHQLGLKFHLRFASPRRGVKFSLAS